MNDERTSRNAGDGKDSTTPHRRGGVDRRGRGDTDYQGPERRRGERRKAERAPDKPIKR